MPDKIIDAAKLFVQYAWAILVVTAAILFVPPPWLAPLGIGPAVSLLRPYIGISFLAASVLVVGRAGQVGWAKITNNVASRKNMTLLQERLQRLTTDEQEVLQPFIRAKTRTQYLHWQDGIVAGLEQAQVIYCAASVKQLDLPCAYNMQNWAYTYLTEHPELVGHVSAS